MSRFVLHPEASADLDQIWEYIAADSLDSADHLLEEIYETVASLSRFHPGFRTRATPAQILRPALCAL